MTEIKLCGLFRPEDIDYANEAQPDFIGFVFAAASPRFVTPAKARCLRLRLDSHIPAVGVFVNAPYEDMQAAFDSGIVQYVQLHGQESEAVVDRLRAHHIPVIRAVPAGPIQYETRADYILIDSANPGSGHCFDWKTAYRPQRPFFLAGGITPDNVNTAINTLQPTVVDVSSGIETNHVKDRQKILSIVRSVHHANCNGQK